jgi:type VI secretion system protein ImpJ
MSRDIQRQAGHCEHILRSREFRWGVVEMTIDRAALAVGTFALSSAIGVLDDGTSFAIPHDDAAPAPIDVPESACGQRVLLARPRQATGAGELQLVLEAPQADLGGLPLLPLARVAEVRGDRRVILEDELFADRAPFIPPCLSIVPTVLADFATELKGMMQHRAEALATRLRSTHLRESALARIMMLQILNGFAPIVAHAASGALVHPRVFHELLLGVAGQLATLDVQKRRPPDFPAYDHNDLQETFSPLIQALRGYVMTMSRISAVQLPLELRKFGVRVAALTPEARSMLRPGRLVLAARGPLIEALQRKLPASVRIAPVEQIAHAAGRAPPGIGLHPLPVAPPAELPYVPETAYFELDRASEAYRDLARSAAIAIHVPPEEWLEGLELELWASVPEWAPMV